MFCHNCGRAFQDGETYGMLFKNDHLVPVCHDDRICFPIEVKHMEKVRDIAKRFHQKGELR